MLASEEGGPPLRPKAPDNSDLSAAGRLIVRGAGMRISETDVAGSNHVTN